VKGKDQIAELFSRFGMRLITDMLPTAIQAKAYDEKIMSLRMQLDRARQEFNDFKNCL
jgi:hypothetical protein